MEYATRWSSLWVRAIIAFMIIIPVGPNCGRTIILELFNANVTEAVSDAEADPPRTDIMTPAVKGDERVK
eukprot:CAMPEP_0194444278 /NCGR_PEP_ID=MMETSP0176-20130528/127179_1 /TAXON_ID=216777 /ORGANISM="Proboscia alata, Strain PI-D3" /LENGTH=69 /DNA_ID=CAMNT_0039270639 /DNA_START=597 /DNA_END=806 /DNA_ORIENTATION=+